MEKNLRPCFICYNWFKKKSYIWKLKSSLSFIVFFVGKNVSSFFQIKALCFRLLLSSSFKSSTLVDSKNMALISEKSLWLFKWKILLNIIGDLKSKLESSFYDIFLLILWSKRLCTKFCSGLISFHDTVELQSFDVSDVIPATIQNISLLFFLVYF